MRRIGWVQIAIGALLVAVFGGALIYVAYRQSPVGTIVLVVTGAPIITVLLWDG